VAPDKVKDKTFDEITTILLQHYEPKPLVISERFNFNRRQQAANELIADYVAELRRLSAHCEFGTFLDDALRNRFVCGLQSKAVQKKLLVEISLTFTCALEIAQNMGVCSIQGEATPQPEKCWCGAERRVQDVG